MQLAVAGALELLEDDLIHSAARIDQSRADNRQRSAFLDLSGGTKESLGRLQGRRVHAAGEDLARVRRLGIVGTGQAGNAVQQDNHILAVLDHSLGLGADHLGDLYVPAGGLVERRGYDLGGRVPLHVRHFLGALVDQQDDDVDVRVVIGDSIGHLLEQDGLAGPRRGDDQHSLAETDRRDKVADPHVEFFGRVFQKYTGIGVRRREVLEIDLLGQSIRRLVVDGLDAKQREVLLGLLGRPNLPGDDIALPQAETTNLTWRDVDVIRAWQVVVVRAAKETKAVRQNLQHALAIHQAILLDAVLEDLEDEFLLGESGVLFEIAVLGHRVQLGDAHLLQIGNVQIAPLYPLVLLMHLLVKAGDRLLRRLLDGCRCGHCLGDRSFGRRSGHGGLYLRLFGGFFRSRLLDALAAGHFLCGFLNRLLRRLLNGFLDALGHVWVQPPKRITVLTFCPSARLDPIKGYRQRR